MNEFTRKPENGGEFFDAPNEPTDYGTYATERTVDTSDVQCPPERGVAADLELDPCAGFSEAGPEPSYEDRLAVPAELKDWSTPWPEYDPPAFTSEEVRTTGVELEESDPESPTEVDFSTRPSFMGEYDFDDQGRPLNPAGRQGLADRGDLAKWGVNNAADPVVVAETEAADRKILLIKRGDGGGWALPGGMVEAGEHVSQAAKRELGEEASVNLGDAEGEVVYEGYVDDPRNTDHAWIETSARLFRLPHAPEARAGSDAAAVGWFDCNNIEELRTQIRGLEGIGEDVEPLYASHGHIIERALGRLSLFEESE